MKRSFFLALVCLVGYAGYADVNFDKYFIDQTMRLDYYHTGNADEEHFAFDAMINDGVWPGSKVQLIDNIKLGKYFFEVLDLASNEVLYSRGFSSIYGEWETTGEAKTQWGVLHESVRFPWPKGDVKVIIYKRNIHNTFDQVWEYAINTKHHRAFTRSIDDFYNVYPIVENGKPATQVDIVVLGEGYTKDEMDKFHKDAERFAEVLLDAEPFAASKDKFSIRAVETPSPHSGVNHPHQDIETRSALSVTYGAFNSQRYALGYDNRTIRDASVVVPYDFTVILMNDSIYGGGGIYNLYITAAVDNAFQEYLFVHEFGHHFADLADEYYTSATAYDMNQELIEPWELNVTANTDPETIKWKDILTEDTPVPTPWDKEKYDEHSIAFQKERAKPRAAKAPENVMETFFIEKREWDDKLLAEMEYSGRVGAFEGARYEATGLYRSAPNCIMFTRHDKFCPACQRAINMIIDQYSK